MHRAAGTVVLFFLTLQVLEFHTRRAAVRWGCSPRRFYFLFLTLLFLADPGNRARALSLARAFTISTLLCRSSPAEEPPLLFYLARPVFVSLCLSLSMAYYMRFLAFVHGRLCSHGRASNLIRSFARGPPGERETVRVECESGQTAKRERWKKKRYNKRG